MRLAAIRDLIFDKGILLKIGDLILSLNLNDWRLMDNIE